MPGLILHVAVFSIALITAAIPQVSIFFFPNLWLFTLVKMHLILLLN